MKASRRPAKKSAAQETRMSRAAQAKSRRELDKFKKFVFSNLRRLENGEPILMILQVVKDPCGHRGGTSIMSGMIKGPPYFTIEQ